MLPVHGTSGLVAGLALGTTYVLSVGPNNMMIIREGLVRGRVVTVSSLMLASYLILLLASYALTDQLSTLRPWAIAILSWTGVAAMIWFAASSIRAGVRGGAREHDAGSRREPLQVCLRRVAGVAVINPLMYVEFLLIPAAVSATLKDPQLRLEFMGGLIIMAAVACYGYALGGRACAVLLRNRLALRVFDLTCGVLLAYLAASLGLGLLAQAG